MIPSPLEIPHRLKTGGVRFSSYEAEVQGAFGACETLPGRRGRLVAGGADSPSRLCDRVVVSPHLARRAIQPIRQLWQKPGIISSSPCVRKMPPLSLSLATLHEHKFTFTSPRSSIIIPSRSCVRFLPFVILYFIIAIPSRIRIPDYYKANSLHRLTISRLTVARIPCSLPALFMGGNFSFLIRFEVPGRTVRRFFVKSNRPLFVIRSFVADGVV